MNSEWKRASPYIIVMNDESAFPTFRPAQEITELFEQGALRSPKEDPWLPPLSDASAPAKQREKRDALWAMIRPLVLDKPAIFDPGPRGRAVLRLVEQRIATKQIIYRLLRRYWQRGMIPNALLPDFHRCGGPVLVRTRRRRLPGGPHPTEATSVRQGPPGLARQLNVGSAGTSVPAPDRRDDHRCLPSLPFPMNRG